MLQILSCLLILAALSAIIRSEPVPIINGVTAAPTIQENGETLMPNSGQYPYMVSVETPKGLCGGVIIKKDIVLTAAHCTLVKKALTVIPGIFDVDDILARQHAQRVDQSAITRHPEFKTLPSGNMVYDVAILRVKRDFEIGKYVNVIKLAMDDHTDQRAFVLGWGSTKRSQPNVRYSDLLRRAGLTILSAKECKQEFMTIPKNKITNSMLCAIHPQREQTTCTGDSGGPLIIPNGKGPRDDELVGLVSWGTDCNPYYPAVFARISAMRSWIVQTAGI